MWDSLQTKNHKYYHHGIAAVHMKDTPSDRHTLFKRLLSQGCNDPFTQKSRFKIIIFSTFDQAQMNFFFRHVPKDLILKKFIRSLYSKNHCLPTRYGTWVDIIETFSIGSSEGVSHREVLLWPWRLEKVLDTKFQLSPLRLKNVNQNK